MHIEQNSLSAHGQLVRGTGLDNITDSLALTTICSGLKTALCEVNWANSIKKARSCVLYELLLEEFEESFWLKVQTQYRVTKRKVQPLYYLIILFVKYLKAVTLGFKNNPSTEVGR